MKQATLFKVVTERVMIQDLRDQYSYVMRDTTPIIGGPEIIVNNILEFTTRLPVHRLRVSDTDKYVIISPETQ